MVVVASPIDLQLKRHFIQKYSVKKSYSEETHKTSQLHSRLRDELTTTPLSVVLFVPVWEHPGPGRCIDVHSLQLRVSDEEISFLIGASLF